MSSVLVPSSTLSALIGGQLSIGEAASMTGLSKSTLWRLWDRHDWIDHCEGTTLRSLIAVFPTVGQYLQSVAVHERLDHALQTATSSGLSIKWNRIDDLRRHTSLSAIASVVEAATAIRLRRASDAWRLITLCWGADKDIAVEALFHTDAIFAETENIVETAVDLIQSTSGEPTSGKVGYSMVVHKLVKSGVLSATSGSKAAPTPPSPFEERSRVIGEILSRGDTRVVDRYVHKLRSSRPHLANEAWSMATYSGDMRIEASAKEIRRIPLTRTGIAVAEDLVSRENAYVYYLSAVAIGRLLAIDPHLGGQRLRVVEALDAVRDRTDLEPRTIDSALTLRKQLMH